jgi:hypothetical protein
MKTIDIYNDNDKYFLQKLIQKIIVWKFSSNLDKELSKYDISHANISRQAGRVQTAFNKTIRQVEDIRISSFIRYWISIQDLIKVSTRYKNINISFESLIDEEIVKLSHFASELSDEEIDYIANLDAALLIGLKVHIQRMRLIKNVLKDEEIQIYEKVLSNMKE